MGNLRPSNSTVASIGIGVPIATIISWLLNTCCDIPVPAEVQAAMGAAISAAVGYFFQGGRHDDVA